MYDKPSLEILEVNYSISPGGIDEFEVYSLDERDHSNPPAQWEEKELAYEASR